MIMITSASFDDFTRNWRNKKANVKYHILIFITSGKVRYEINGETLVAEKSEFVYVPAGSVRAAEDFDENPHQKYAVFFSLEGVHATSLPLASGGCHRSVRSHSFEYIRQRFATLYQHWIEKQPFYETVAAGIFTEIFALANREAGLLHASPGKQKLANRMKAHIAEHYRKPLRVEQLASLIGRSPNYAISLFKETTGQTPVEYMLHLRISAARDLLLHSNMSNGQIADYLGFYDSSYFFRVFKRLTGLSPSEMRQSGGG